MRQRCVSLPSLQVHLPLLGRRPIEQAHVHSLYREEDAVGSDSLLQERKAS